MKTRLLLLTVPALLLAEPVPADLKWVDEHIEAIKPARQGLHPNSVAVLRDPFTDQLILNQPPAEEGEPVEQVIAPEPDRAFTLQAIINRSTAMIDGSWYKKDDDVHGYTVKAIEDDGVLLQKRSKKLKLSLTVDNSNIEIKTK